MKLERGFLSVGFIVAALLPAVTAMAADWNQWRGPNRDGIAKEFKPPVTWSTNSLAKTWSVAVGEGHSSPVVVGDCVFIFTRDDDKEVMRCLSTVNGKLVWQDAYPVPYEMNPAARNHGKGPKSTPAVANGTVFALGINGHLSAYDASTGAIRWRKDFACDFKSTAPVFGASASPIVEAGNVIVHVGGDDSGALTAFDAATGNVKWQWDGDGPAYTSPIIATLGGIRQVITQSQKYCLAVSPSDGRLLWKLPFSTPFDQNSVTPVVVGDLVIFGGVQKPTFALKVRGADVATAWETREITMYMSSPIVDNTTVYGMSDKQRGSLFIINASDGSVVWRGEGRLGANASLTDVGWAILVMTDTGELIVQEKARTSLKELAKFKVANSPVWASPAVVGDQIFIKDKTTLALYKVVDGD